MIWREPCRQLAAPFLRQRSYSANERALFKCEKPSTSSRPRSSDWNGTRSSIVSVFGRSSMPRPSSFSTSMRPFRHDDARRAHLRHGPRPPRHHRARGERARHRRARRRRRGHSCITTNSHQDKLYACRVTRRLRGRSLLYKRTCETAAILRANDARLAIDARMT